MHTVILSIGDELALGQTVDTNSAYLSARLARQGVLTLYHQTLADDLPAMVEAIQRAAASADLVLISGGIGPTDDDLTRQALAQAMGVELVSDPEAVAHLEAFFAKRGRTMPPRNAVQAMRPEPATMIPNACGTAPGLRAAFKKAVIYVTPGVPREMEAMFLASIEPEVARFAGGRGVILTTKVNTFGLGESDVADRLGELMARDRRPRVGTTVADGFCCVRVRSEAADVETARAALDDTVAQVEARLSPTVFGRDEQTLVGALCRELVERGKTVATAESCTGGLVGAMLTEVPGVSAAYVGGWITYTNAMKVAQLGVSQATLDAHGAVSEPVAREMARGALQRSGADLAVSVSGIAGPGGGTLDKPVGLVWFALARRGGSGGDGGDGMSTAARFAQLPGDRDQVRDRAAKGALQMLRLTVQGQSLEALRWLKSIDDADTDAEAEPATTAAPSEVRP